MTDKEKLAITAMIVKNQIFCIYCGWKGAIYQMFDIDEGVTVITNLPQFYCPLCGKQNTNYEMNAALELDT